MRDNWLSNRIFSSYDNVVDHCCHAWNRLMISHGASCPSGHANGRMGHDQRVMV